MCRRGSGCRTWSAAAEISHSMSWECPGCCSPLGEAVPELQTEIKGCCSDCSLETLLGGAIPDLLLPCTGSRGSNVWLAQFSRSLQHFQQWSRCPGMSSMAQELSPAKQRIAFLCHPPGGTGSSRDLSFSFSHGLEI